MKTIIISILCSFSLFAQYLVSDSKAELQSINSRVHQGIYGSVQGYNAQEYFKIDSVSIDTSFTVNQRVVKSMTFENSIMKEVSKTYNDTTFSYTYKYFALIPDSTVDKRNPQRFLTNAEKNSLVSKTIMLLNGYMK